MITHGVLKTRRQKAWRVTQWQKLYLAFALTFSARSLVYLTAVGCQTLTFVARAESLQPVSAKRRYKRDREAPAE